MPFTAQNLLEGRDFPVTVEPHDSTQKALELMLEYDFSQLPVIDRNKEPKGIITTDSILRGLVNFGVRIENLRVRDVMETVRPYSGEESIFDLLDVLESKPAILIVNNENKLIGIITNWDSTAYFLQRSENMMLIEDIEATLKEHIQAAFASDMNRLQEAINEVSNAQSISIAKDVLKKYLSNMPEDSRQIKGEWFNNAYLPLKNKTKTLNDLTLYQLVQLFVHKSSWPIYSKHFTMDEEAIRNLFKDVQEIRNTLMHFRDEITSAQHDKLRFCVQWLETNPPVFPEVPIHNNFELESAVLHIASTLEAKLITRNERKRANESSYALLAEHLLNQPPSINEIAIPIDEIEKIVRVTLPASARKHRSWWANDTVSHSQSKQWLEVGWRVSDINFVDEVITFSR